MSRDLLRRGNAFATPLAYQQRLNTKTSKLECIGVGNGKDGHVYLYCTDCGATFTKSKSKMRPSNQKRLICPYCEKLYVELNAREKVEEISKRIEARKQETIRRRETEYTLSHTGICERCGKKYFGRPNRKYCSAECASRQSDSNKSHLRRLRINNNYHDNISTILLAKRDKDVCWICKKKVDWQDFTINENGYRVTGKNYPSQDHVVPLAKGGTHTWDNVRLAHFKCNTEKGDKLFTQKENGQIILFC